MQKIKSPSESLCISRKLVMPDQINPNGSLFGGVLMSWMDKVCFMAAQRHSERTHVVTVNIDQIHFKQPLKVGDHVILTAGVDYVGRSSMEIGVRVENENLLTSERYYCASALMTFVALNEHSKPVEVPRLVPKSQEELDRFAHARARAKIRGRLRSWLEERFPRQFCDQAMVG